MSTFHARCSMLMERFGHEMLMECFGHEKNKFCFELRFEMKMDFKNQFDFKISLILKSI